MLARQMDLFIVLYVFECKNHVFGMLKRLEMLVLVCILKMASARMGATDSRMILADSSLSFGGMELVTITWSSCEFLMF